MNFRVDPGAIEGFAKLVRRAADETAQAVTYTTAHTQLDQGMAQAEGLWSFVTGNHQSYVDGAKLTLRAVQQILGSSASELTKAAAYYRRTDRAQAAKMDATYPASKAGGGLPKGGGAQDFSDKSDATSLLKQPDGGSDDPVAKRLSDYFGGHADEYKMNPAQKTTGTFLDLASPSALIVEGAKLVVGVDPFAEMNKWIFGDWNKYIDCAEAWGNLGSFCDAVAANLRKGAANLGLTWDGNAADAALVYFDEFAKKLAAAKQSFVSLQKTYMKAAQEAFQFGETVKAGAVALSDLVIVYLATKVGEFAARRIPHPVVAGGGTVVAGALGAVAMWKIINKWKGLVHGFNAIQLAFIGYGALASTAVNELANVQAFPQVGSGYDHRAV